MNQGTATIALISLAAASASPAAAGIFETLYRFDTASGAQPYSGVVIDASGNLFGTTSIGPGGGFGLGTVYRFGTDGTLSILHSFDGTDGRGPLAGLVAAPGRGSFYGATTGGGANDRGTIFRIGSDGSHSVLYNLDIATGANIENAMIVDKAGNLFGVAASSSTGPYSAGSLFKFGTDGEFSVLHAFDNAFQAGVPIGAPVLDPFGNLYGTTLFGGIGGGYGGGTIFRLSADGDFSIVHSFAAADGVSPYGRLVSDLSGNIFGTTSQGGSGLGGGTIFRLATDGTYSVLHSFDTQSAGYMPLGGLTIDAAGNLFGTTQRGGAFGDFGTIFRFGADGVFTTLHSFAGGDGGQSPLPYGWLEADANGNLYGTTTRGGAFDYGTIFKLSDVGFVTSIDPPGGVIPEPASWAMMIAGFGLVGGAMRRRRTPASFLA